LGTKNAPVLGRRVISSTGNIVDVGNKYMVKYFVMILIIKKADPIIVFLNAHKRGAGTWTIN